MKKGAMFFFLVLLGMGWQVSGAWAIDVGWMQKGVRVWYLGAAGSGMSSDAQEAYLFADINGNTAQLIRHSGINHWSLPTEETMTGSVVGKGPFWIHPQVLQTIAVGDNWMGIDIKSMNRAIYTYDTFKNNAEFSSLLYLLLPIKALFDLKNQREIVKLVYGNPNYPDFDEVWGTAYFDSETGLCLFNLRLTAFNTVCAQIDVGYASLSARKLESIWRISLVVGAARCVEEIDNQYIWCAHGKNFYIAVHLYGCGGINRLILFQAGFR